MLSLAWPISRTYTFSSSDRGLKDPLSSIDFLRPGRLIEECLDSMPVDPSRVELRLERMRGVET